ncbi:MAG: DUF434 domain-containing protein [Myxococcota bacterium]
MVRRRRHRGPHPQDEELFAAAAVPRLREAVSDLSWLRTRRYAEPSATKIVGDRHQLRARQRTAVGRCACPDEAVANRAARRIAESEVRGEALMLDGLNVLTTIEVALAHGVLLIGRDGCVRDMASFHGNYRLVHETDPAIACLLDALDSLEPRRVEFLIDRPVSNSGRLAQAIRDAAHERGAEVHPVLSDRVDATLKTSQEAIVATADSAILDACGRWLNLARLAIHRLEDLAQSLWLLDLG